MKHSKFEARCNIGDYHSAYAMLDWKMAHHHARLKRFIGTMATKLTCQECHGQGGEIEVVIPETGQGPWYDCGFCEGIGLVTPWARGGWLRYKRQEKRAT